ncbi:MAG: D-glycero-beta-D-manno-heptose 1-phosphate adenylyltransferase [Candidatus Ancaeobacter aquaticus]|nr:D-glycero-beta-D-manno-heptose 1-phosphate adenylyltransferase [Candidatus Ancaeobacter aquaticus]
MKTKIISRTLLKKKIQPLRKQGKKIVFTNGCFDIIHFGHVSYLEQAKACGDFLVVGLNDDKSVRKIKGNGRPIVSQNDRARVLAGLEAVDCVVLFNEDTPYNLIKTCRPDILVKGADYSHKEIVGNDLMKEWGGKVTRIRLLKNRSTSNLIKLLKGQL